MIIRSNYKKALVFLFAVLAWNGSNNSFAADSQGSLSQTCEPDPHMTYADMEEKAHKDSKFLGAKTVPKDLEIDAVQIRYAVTTNASGHIFPDANSQSLTGFKPGYRDQASCRVKDTHGVWWFATRYKDGVLGYISAVDAMPEKDYEEEIRTSNMRWKNRINNNGVQ
jgi:hypothetical protein